MSAAAKRTVLAAASILALVALSILVPVGGASSERRDSEPPTTPRNVRVAGATQSLVRIAWDPSTDNVGVKGYYVFGDKGKATVDVLDDQGKPILDDDGNPIGDAPGFTVEWLGCGESTEISVIAFDASQNRSGKATVTVSTAACGDLQPPTAPSAFTQVATSTDSVVLAWAASYDNVGVVEYGVNRDLQRVATPTQPTVTLTGLSCGSTYVYAVDAADAAGNRSPLATAYVQTASCPSPSDTISPSTPTGLAASNITQTGMALNWNASSDNVGVTGYDVYRNGTKVASVTSTSASQSSLSCGASYSFGVRARDAAGRTSAAAQLTVSTAACSTTPPPTTDTISPSTPTGLAASNITQTGMALNWNASSDNVGVTGYDVYRNGARVASVTSTSVDQSGVSCGTSYPFAVRARDAAGRTSAAAQLTVSTAACSTTPPPTDTTPPSTPTGLGISSATRTSVSLTWNPSTDNVGVAGYRLYVNGSFNVTTTQPGTTVSNVSCGTAYIFAVDALDAEGNNSPQASVTGSTAACADTQAPTTPTNVVASSRTASSIALSWSASSDSVGVAGYGLYRGGVEVGSNSTTTGIFAGLTCNTNYTLAVDAYDAAGNRSAKTTVMVSTTACPDTQPPSAPTGLAATNVTQTDLTLAWTASSDNVGVTGYDVLRNGTKVATVTGTSSSQAGLTCGTGYTFAVVARDVAGNSSSPAQLSAATAPCSLTGTAFYVDPAGSDASDGAVNRPWRTLAKACASVPSNAGATIVMRAGTYVESSTCNLPPKTNLQGAGGRNGATTIKGSADPLISLVNASGAANVQTVSGIKLDGQNRTAGTRGMKVENVRGLTIRDMLGEGFKGADAGGALDLNKVWNADVGDSIFRNSAGIFPTFAAGSLGIRNATDSVFHDLIASDDKAMGIKGGWLGATLTNVEFYNLRVTCGSPTVSTGGGTTWPAISFEMNNMDVTNVTIRNSYFNATLSLTAPDSVGQLPSGQWRYQVYNNHFDIPSQAQTGQLQYALELHNHSSDVHHNFFDGGVHPISEFGSMPHRGNRVHHNVFANGENYSGLMRIKPGLFDFEFYKNTFVWQQSWINMLFRADELTPSSNPNIHDNIFASTASLGDTLGPGLASATITRNVFYNITARGTNALTSNPQLPLSGGFPNAYIPNPGSPAQTYGAFADGAWSGVGPQ